MRVVLDTTILISALIGRGTAPDQLYELWKYGRFELATCERQLQEVHRVSRRPFFKGRTRPAEAGRMINDIGRLAISFNPLPTVERSRDPADDWLLARAEASGVEFLVTGHKSDLLALGRHAGTRIVTARYLVDQLTRP